MGVHDALTPAEAAPLFAGLQDGLVLSALSGAMGRIRVTDSGAAALITLGDFATPAGDPRDPDAAALLFTLTQDDHLWIVAPPSVDWHPLVEAIPGVKATLGERYALTLDPGTLHWQALQTAAETLPQGVHLAPIDGALYQKSLTADWSRDFVALFQDEADYLARGLGVMALKDGEPVAGASSYAVHPGGIEIEIDTRADHRRQGLATACGAALMLRSLERGLLPGWDADNPASLALAQKLGYRFLHAYPVYRLSA